MGEVIDLDALVPANAILLWKGKQIPFEAPEVEDILVIGNLATQAEVIQDIKSEEAKKVIAEMQAVFWRLIPELNEEPLSLRQLLALVRAVSDMVVPPDAKELAARGITLGGDDKKKDPLDSPTS